ncbi:MAG: SCO family protein [Candidatus Dadabacteria bacterium]
MRRVLCNDRGESWGEGAINSEMSRYLSNLEIIKRSLLILVFLTCCPPAYAITSAADVKDIGVDEKLGSYIPLDLTFRDEHGNPVKLNGFFHDGKPVILTLNYYECPLLCTYVLNGILDVVNKLDSLSLGRDFRIVTVSFNPSETPELARKKAANYLKELKNTQPSQRDWHFLTGDEEDTSALAQAVGFRYKKDGNQFAHPSVVVILTPQGEISRYFYGIQYQPKDLWLALLEASKGEIGSSKILNQILLYCYHFDPVGKKYALQALNIVKAGGVVTLLCVGGLLTYLWRNEKKRTNGGLKP